MEMHGKKERYHLIDEFRGLLILNMIAYHAFWDLNYLYGFEWEWYRGTPGAIWQFWICSSFIMLAGYCWQMGKHQLKHGIVVSGAGLLITLVTLMVMPGARVIFGVLTFHGTAMLLLIPLSKLLEKIPAVLGMSVSLILFAISYTVNDGYLGLGNLVIWEVPKEWYANMFTTYLGFPKSGFWSTDYFSVFPWIFLAIAGYFAYTIGKNRKAPDWVKKSVCPPLGFLGRHSLIIYMLHQPVIYGICVILFGEG